MHLPLVVIVFLYNEPEDSHSFIEIGRNILHILNSFGPHELKSIYLMLKEEVIQMLQSFRTAVTHLRKSIIKEVLI